jgi:predicted aspartyl protease
MSRNWLQFNPKRAPVVSVRIGKGVFPALVDTGAEVSLIAPNTALRLGLPKAGTNDILPLAGGRLSLTLVELPNVGFGNIELPPCKAAIHNVTRIGLPIELILGVNAFVGCRLMIDFREGRIYLLE